MDKIKLCSAGCLNDEHLWASEEEANDNDCKCLYDVDRKDWNQAEPCNPMGDGVKKEDCIEYKEYTISRRKNYRRKEDKDCFE